jgi:hypothetical protein
MSNGNCGEGEEVSASFFEKKEAKKLMLLGAFATPGLRPTISKSFLLLFFQKRSAFFSFH